MRPIEPSSIVKKSANQVSCKLDEEVAILQMTDSLYYGLNEVGAHIWHLLDEPRSVHAICTSVSDQFEISEEGCRGDVLGFLAALGDAGLIEASL